MLYVGIGGFLGANARYISSLLVGRLFPQLITSYSTFFVNVAGSLLLAIFLAWAGKQVDLSPAVRLLFATGFFGSFTTFSSFANEGVTLARDGFLWSAGLYIIGMNIICIIAVFIGIWLGSRL
jgi:CrcB protein